MVFNLTDAPFKVDVAETNLATVHSTARPVPPPGGRELFLPLDQSGGAKIEFRINGEEDAGRLVKVLDLQHWS